MSTTEKKCECKKKEDDNKHDDNNENLPLPRTTLKTSTETSAVFFMSKFNSTDIYHEEKLPHNFKDLEHLLNKILINLDETETVFLNQAKAVLDRDLILINWRIRLKDLQKNLKEKKDDFERIDQTVQCIFKLCSHIECILSKLEKELPELSLINNAFKYTPVRMSMYDAMLNINVSQKDMLQRLANAVISLNEAAQFNPLDPVEQFTRILSLHVEVLRTIERKCGTVEEQLRVIKTLYEFYTSTKKPLIYDYY